MFLINSSVGSLAAAPSHYLLLDMISKLSVRFLLTLSSTFSRFAVRAIKTYSLKFEISKKKTDKYFPVTVINTVMGQTLSRSYGRYIAEFLNEESLVHLGLLDLSTCVGFGTDGYRHEVHRGPEISNEN